MFLRIITLLSLMIALSFPAAACRYKPMPFETLLKKSETVFIGTVKSVEDRKVTWAVEKGVKGIKDGETFVSDYGGTSCDTRFQEGQRWLFLGPHVPSGSQLIENEVTMKETLKWLEAFKKE